MYVYVRGTTAAGDGHLMAAVDNPAPKDSHPVPWNHTAANRVVKLLRDQTTVDFDAEEAWQTIWTLRDWYRLALVLQIGRLLGLTTPCWNLTVRGNPSGRASSGADRDGSGQLCRMWQNLAA